MAGFFGGKDPFDHPFFTQPFGLFGESSPFDNPFFSNPFGNQPGNSRQRISIEEINPDGNHSGDNVTKDDVYGKELSVNSQNGKPTGGFQSFSFQRVAVGGTDGIYYTSSVEKRTGDDGVFMMEVNEEDKMVGESLHTVSKGIHDKGHSVTTKKSANGQVDSLQTMHNLNEDELVGFHENWQNNANKALPGWSNGFNFLNNPDSDRNLFDDFGNWAGWGGWHAPSLLEYFGDGFMRPSGESTGQSSSGTSRRNIPIE